MFHVFCLAVRIWIRFKIHRIGLKGGFFTIFGEIHNAIKKRGTNWISLHVLFDYEDIQEVQFFLRQSGFTTGGDCWVDAGVLTIAW